jgi:hypothetical protein
MRAISVSENLGFDFEFLQILLGPDQKGAGEADSVSYFALKPRGILEGI